MSKQRNLRKSKLSFADEEEEEELAAPADNPSGPVHSSKNQDKKKGLLSFQGPDDDNIEDSGKLTKDEIKPGLSIRQKARKAAGLRIPPPPPSNIAPNLSAKPYYNTQMASVGEYTVERLKELQNATLKPPRIATKKHETDVDDGSGLVAQHYQGEDVDDEDLGPAPSALPDQHVIAQAKAKREESRSGKPFLHLHAVYKEEDESDVAQYAGMKTIMDRKVDAIRERMKLKGEDIDSTFLGNGDAGVVVEEDKEDEEEEEAAWAEDQIRKGITSAGNVSALKKYGAATKKTLLEYNAASMAPSLPPSSQAASIASAAEEAVAALKAAFQRAQLSQSQAEKNLSRTEKNLADSIANLERIEEEAKRAGDRYVYLQGMREYVTAICAMLAEKSPLIEELQEELERAREERASAHVQRCVDAEKEARDPAEAAIHAALTALSNGASQTEAQKAAQTAAEASISTLSTGSHIPIALDEFGRDKNAPRRVRVAQRMKKEPDTASMATTSESEDESIQYVKRREDVLEACRTVFEDASPEFSTLPAVKTKLEELKFKYPYQYTDAYMSDSVPALFAPFVRLELLEWYCPLDGTKNFNQLSWYPELFDYGMPPKGSTTAAVQPNDPDVDLLPRVIKALLVPITMRVIERVWNPLSCRQTSALADTVSEIMIYTGNAQEDVTVKNIHDEIVKRLKQSVKEAYVPTTWPPAALAVSRRAQVYMEKAIKKTLRLVRNIYRFSGILENPALLHELAVQGLVVKFVLPWIRSAIVDPGTLGERVVQLLDSMPAHVLATETGNSHDFLQGLRDVVDAAVRSVESASGVEERRTALQPAAHVLSSVLDRLGDKKGALRLRLMFDVK